MVRFNPKWGMVDFKASGPKTSSHWGSGAAAPRSRSENKAAYSCFYCY